MGEREEDDMRDDRIKESVEKETRQGMRPKAAFGIYTTLNRLAKKRPIRRSTLKQTAACCKSSKRFTSQIPRIL